MGHEAHRAALTPDAGLWEYREREEVHTFSAAMCWAAQHRLGLIARRVGFDAESREWLAKAGVLRQEILQRGTTSEGWLSGVLDRDMADASSLVFPEIGLLRSDDPRFHATLDMVSKRLMKNGFLMRYVEADDFGAPSNAFLLCTFWYIDAVEEALCFGWIDSTVKKTTEGLTVQKLSPRKSKSNWTELNKERCRRLERLGRMTDAGRAALPDMSEGSFTVDDDILQELQSDPTLWDNYCRLPELYKRVRIDRIRFAKDKQPQLFKNRLDKFIENIRKGILYGEWNDNGRL